MVGPIVYVRLHGYGTKYGGSYPNEVLDEWADWIRGALASGRDVYAYFNNDINGYAVYDAKRLRLRVEGVSARHSNLTQSELTRRPIDDSDEQDILCRRAGRWSRRGDRGSALGEETGVCRHDDATPPRATRAAADSRRSAR
jgi:hypothetical protein